MSSHREAPEISKDPVADSTDLYAFVTPGHPDMVTLIANYLPFQLPAGGPNFFEFGTDVQYDINIDNNGDGYPEVIYRFTFETKLANDNTFLYNTGPIESLDSKNWNRKQFYKVSRIDGHGKEQVLAHDVPCPPCNIGPLSTPDYSSLAYSAIHKLPGGGMVFAGQRADGFFVDLGSIFDLGTLRPFEQLHEQFGLKAFSKAATGVNTLNGFNVHSIALQVPINDVVRGGKWGKWHWNQQEAVIGVWTSASRSQVAIRNEDGNAATQLTGPAVQVSRLGNPLFNEVIVPMAQKDVWNSLSPAEDKRFAQFVEHPELAGLLPVLYPTVFPNLDALNKAKTARADLVAILLTGIPNGVVDGFQNSTGLMQADMLRLNTAIPAAAKPNPLGVVAGDVAGFPNGRRVTDDVVTIALRAVAGLTFPLIDKTFKPDAATSQITDGLTAANVKAPFLAQFPFLATPFDGFSTPS
jgi:hypothetical protein